MNLIFHLKRFLVCEKQKRVCRHSTDFLILIVYIDNNIDTLIFFGGHNLLNYTKAKFFYYQQAFWFYKASWIQKKFSVIQEK
jgi:hypothetical protein